MSLDLTSLKKAVRSLESRNDYIDAQCRRMVESILERRLPDREARAFGSRVTGTAKPYSDLDLVVMGSVKLPTPTLYALRDDFEESELPFRVDVLDWNRLSPKFQNSILAHSEILHGSRKS